jgi:suppressor for copper-sensitivity B
MNVDWPLPVRFSVLGLETLGYKNEVVLPLTLAPFEPGKPVSLRVKMPYLTCADICVPYQAELTLDLPAGPETTSLEAGLIEQYAAQVPKKGADAALSVAAAEIDGKPGRQTVRIVANAATQFSNPDVLIEGPPGFLFGKARLKKIDQGVRAVMVATVTAPRLKKQGDTPTDLVGSPLTLTMINGRQAIEQTIAARQGQVMVPPATAPPVSALAFLSILGLAVLGGLILNLMPCVLPVLSLKLLSVVGHGGSNPGPVRKGFLASAAGIVVSFLVLGTAAVALKAGGHAAGWGIQFQHPLFLTITATIVALFAANLWGLFEIRLPGVVAEVAAGAGQDHRNGLSKHFLTGAFATLLATPCSAPFLGTAVGFALARGPAEIYAIFTALGIGLALPYLLIAAVPSLATRLPRPGPWMVTLRRILGLALVATALWLLTVLDTQAGRASALLGGGLIVIFLVILAFGHLKPTASRPIIWGCVTVIALLGIAMPPHFAREGNATVADTNSVIRWKPFAPEAIAGHVAAGRTVFVDVTADWCVTCKVNKALVIDSDRVSARLNAGNIIAMKADWTRPDPVITAFLQRFSRYGIPFDVVFGPKSPDGIVLPELLTKNAVLGALDKASDGRAVAGR